jgi:Flp pilus assembly protein TadB
MIGALVAGAGVGCGVAVIMRSTTRRRVSLAGALARLDRVGSTGEAGGGAAGWAVALPAPVAELVGSAPGTVGVRDLAVLGRTPARHAVDKLATAVALTAIGGALGAVLLALGACTPMMALGLVLAAAAVGFVVPDLMARSQAAARRRSFRHALSSYLDLVNVLLAGGAGIETSMVAAADAGDGWAFAALRDELVRARTLRRTPWACFGELGERWGVDELVELAASVRLAGEHGARIRASLAAKASALRAHQMARIEADAQSATERMGMPTVLMFVGFVGLLGYPALQVITTGW